MSGRRSRVGAGPNEDSSAAGGDSKQEGGGEALGTAAEQNSLESLLWQQQQLQQQQEQLLLLRQRLQREEQQQQQQQQQQYPRLVQGIMAQPSYTGHSPTLQSQQNQHQPAPGSDTTASSSPNNLTPAMPQYLLPTQRQQHGAGTMTGTAQQNRGDFLQAATRLGTTPATFSISGNTASAAAAAATRSSPQYNQPPSIFSLLVQHPTANQSYAGAVGTGRAGYTGLTAAQAQQQYNYQQQQFPGGSLSLQQHQEPLPPQQLAAINPTNMAIQPPPEDSHAFPPAKLLGESLVVGGRPKSSRGAPRENDEEGKPPPGKVPATAAAVVAAASGFASYASAEGSSSTDQPSSSQQHEELPMTSSLGPDVKFLAKKRRAYKHEPFPEKLYRMIIEAEEEGKDHVVSFIPDGSAIQIHNSDLFARDIIPKYFRHKKLESFRRQFSMYGFQRLREGPHKGAYQHQLFIKGKPELLPMIRRVSELDIVLPPGTGPPQEGK